MPSREHHSPARRAIVALLAASACGPGGSPTAPVAGGSQAACLARATFGDAAESPFVLPYPVGRAFLVSQSYCNPNGGHRGTFAYDWPMDRGEPITAARDGVVIVANDQFADDDGNGNENNVFVEHAGGSVVRYTHLQQGSVVVAVGDAVVAGQTAGTERLLGQHRRQPPPAPGGVPRTELRQVQLAPDQLPQRRGLPRRARRAGRGNALHGATLLTGPLTG